MHEQIRTLVDIHGRLRTPIASLDDHEDLFLAGLASFAAVQLLIAIEENYRIEFKAIDSMTFSSIDRIVSVVNSLLHEQLDEMAGHRV